MTFTAEDRKIAQALCKDKAIIPFLTKLLAPELEDFGGEISKNVVALDDAEYGRIMKVLYISREHIKGKINTLKVLGSGTEIRTPRPNAPK